MYILSGEYTFSLPPLRGGEHYVALRLLSQQDDTIISEADTHFECVDSPQQDGESDTGSSPSNMPESQNTKSEKHVSEGEESDLKANKSRKERSKAPTRLLLKGISPQPCELLQNDILVTAQVTIVGPEIR
jgi:hypothetical protein